MSFKDKILKSQSPWGSNPGGGSGNGNGSGTRREPPNIDDIIKKDDIIIDSKSGFSGAGKKYKLRFTHKNLDSSIFSYSVKEHRHMAEIDQEIKKKVGNNIKYTFNPHLIPTYRGITSNIYIKLSRKYFI